MKEFKLQAGASKAKIIFAREDFPLKAFTGIHDEIYVRVLILKTTICAALVSIELTSLPQEAVRKFKKECSNVTGINEENVFISVTHTFSAPHIPPHVRSEEEQRLSDIMYNRILTAIRKASEKAKDSVDEAVVEYGEVSCCLNVNRNIATPEGYWIGRNEEEFSDHTVRVLKFRHRDKLFAYLFNYDIQSSVMDKSESVSGGRLISGDLAGAACKELEKENVVTAVFLPGCAGDQAPVIRAVQEEKDGTIKDLHEDGFILVEQFGKYLAERVCAAKGASVCNMDESFIKSEMAVLLEQEMKYETKELRPHTHYFFDLTGKNIQVPITFICLGAVRMLMTTPELNSGFGKKIRKILGENLLIGTLVNGGIKYLPEAQDFENITYEAMNSRLGPGSAEKFLEAVYEIKTKSENL